MIKFFEGIFIILIFLKIYGIWIGLGILVLALLYKFKIIKVRKHSDPDNPNF